MSKIGGYGPQEREVTGFFETLLAVILYIVFWAALVLPIALMMESGRRAEVSQTCRKVTP